MVATELPDGALEEFADLGRRRVLARNSVLCREGDPSDEVYLIESGSVRIVMSPLSGNETIISVRRAGQFVGEIAAFDRRPRSATVIAEELTTVSIIPGDAFVERVASRPALAAHFLQVLSSKIRMADSLTIERTTADVPTRVASRLVALAELRIEQGDPAAGLSIGVRQADLAAWVGSTRETVARILSGFRRDGLIRTGRGSLVIVDLDRLRTRAGSP